MQNPTLKVLLMSTILIAMTSCSLSEVDKTTTQSNAVKTASKTSVQAPNQAWDVPFEKHHLDPSQSMQIQTQGGSTIDIPSGTLVDVQGNPVAGEAEIQYREFHTAADIFRSGIPMRYDSAGNSHILKSAGMFEIRASQNGEELFIAEGKQIDVKMKSSRGGSYNFYKLNEAGDNNWQFIQSAEAQLETKEQSISNHAHGYGHDDVDEEGLVDLVKPEKASETAAVFDFRTNYQVYPELAAYKKVLWQDAEKAAEDVLEIASNDWIFGEVWEDASVKRARIKGGNYYYLDLKNETKEARLLVKPVLEGRAYKKALATYRQNQTEMEALRQKYAQEAQQFAQAQQQAMNNNFYSGVRSFGFYNWDLIIKKGNLQQFAADFYFENGEQPKEVFLIVSEAPVAVKFTQEEWQTFTFSPHWKSMVVAMLPDDRLAIIENETLQMAQIGQGTQKFTFKENVRVAFPNQIAEYFAP
jgi:hypothetical protein